jgi:predicted small metal-binding protein
MDREIGCECGFVARGSDSNALVSQAREHALTIHHMDFSSHQLLSLVRPAVDDELKVTPITNRPTDHQQ